MICQSNFINIIKFKGDKNPVRFFGFWFFPKSEEKIDSSLVYKETRFENFNTNSLSDKSNLALDFSKNSKYLLAGGGDKTKGVIQVIKAESQELAYQTPRLSAEINCLKCSSDGNHVISDDSNGFLTLWKLQNESSQSLIQIDSMKTNGKILAFGCDTIKNGIIVAYEDKKGVIVSQITVA
jgi:WD40 repeat protein